MRDSIYFKHSRCKNKSLCSRCNGQICPPIWLIEYLEEIEKKQNCPLKVETFQYYATSDGEKKVFTDEDELPYYGKVGIIDPNNVSYTNLFINGILQPTSLYSLQKGSLTLNSIDPPIKGTPIILQFITITS
ncbi:MAG TPA: DUF4183 domain-containing protein [Bacillales bacterium]|nr:DUF4183 domain-containing protein [Bacillales bacterium]